ncbi:MAG: metallophosphoesterase [Planctomycetota bacterium]
MQSTRQFVAIVVAWAGLSSMASAQEESTILRGPYLQNLQSDSVEVIWVSRGEALSGRIVALGSDGAPHAGNENDVTTCEALAKVEDAVCHRIVLGGLTPAQAYTYDVFEGETNLTEGRGYAFRTPPAPGQPGLVHFTALGDSGIGTDSQRLVARAMARLAPMGVLHTGDLDYLGDPDRSVFGIYSDAPFDAVGHKRGLNTDLFARSCFFPARGNHDNTYPYPKYFFVPGETDEEESTYYSFDWGRVHVIVLDTTLQFESRDGGRTPGDDMLDFLRADLERVRPSGAKGETGPKWIIATMHSPIFTVGPHVIDREMAKTRNRFTPLFDEYGVELVLMGDDHVYSRSHPLKTSTTPCPELAVHPCDEDPDIPYCYSLVGEDSSPHYTSPGGTVYVVTGGGGQRLYGELTGNDCRFVDRGFLAAVNATWHTVEVRASDAMLEVSAWDMRDAGDDDPRHPERPEVENLLLDRFTISKMRLLRGDVDFDGNVALNDAIGVLNYLFLAGNLSCPAAGEVNGSGTLDIADAVHTLGFLFLGGAPPVAPYPDCGPIPENPGAFCGQTGC